MSYKYLDEVATADIAFVAHGPTLNDLFYFCAQATTNVMLEDIEALEKVQTRQVTVSNVSIEMLLFKFLQEIIYFKDADNLFLLPTTIDVQQKGGEYRVSAKMYADTIDHTKYKTNVDVKAVTLHRFEVIQLKDGSWQATVVLDI